MLQKHAFWQWIFKGIASTSEFQRITKYLFLSANSPQGIVKGKTSKGQQSSISTNF